MPGSVSQELKNAANSLINALDAFGKDLSASQQRGVITQLNLDTEVRDTGIQVTSRLINQWQEKLHAITSGTKTVTELFPDSEGDLGLTEEADIIYKIAQRVDTATAGKDVQGGRYAENISTFVFEEEPKAPQVQSTGVTSLFGDVAATASKLILGEEAGEVAGQAVQDAVTDTIVVIGKIGDTLSEEPAEPLESLDEPETLITEPAADPSPTLTSEALTADPGLVSPAEPAAMDSFTENERQIISHAESNAQKFNDREASQNWNAFFDLVRDNPTDPQINGKYTEARNLLTTAASWLSQQFDTLGLSSKARAAILGSLGLSEQDIQSIQDSFGREDPALFRTREYFAAIRRLPIALAALDYDANTKGSRTSRAPFTLLNAFQNALTNTLESLQAGHSYNDAIDQLVKRDPTLAGAIFGAHLKQSAVIEGYEAQGPIDLGAFFIDPEGKIADADYWGAFYDSIEQAPVAEGKEGSNFERRKRIYYDALLQLNEVIDNLNSSDKEPYNLLKSDTRRKLLGDLKSLKAVISRAHDGYEGPLLSNPKYMDDLALFLRGNLMKTKIFGGTHWAKSHREFMQAIYANRENFGATAKHDLAEELNATPRSERLKIWGELYQASLLISTVEAANAANDNPGKRKIEGRWSKIVKDLGKAAAGNENALFSEERIAQPAFGIIYDVLSHQGYFADGAYPDTLAIVAQVAGREIAATSQKPELAAAQRTSVKVETWDQVTAIIQDLGNHGGFNGRLANKTKEKRLAFYQAVHQELQRLFPENPDEALQARQAALYARIHSPALSQDLVEKILQAFNKLARGLSENANLNRVEYVSLAGVIIDHFGGASDQLQTAIDDLVKSANEHYPQESNLDIEVTGTRPSELTRLRWEPYFDPENPAHPWLKAYLTVSTARDGLFEISVYANPDGGQIAVEYKQNSKTKGARHKRGHVSATYLGAHRPSVTIAGQAVTPSYNGTLQRLQFLAHDPKAAAGAMVTIGINNFNGGKHAPAKILQIKVPDLEKAQHIHAQEKPGFIVKVEGGELSTAYANDEMLAEANHPSLMAEASQGLLEAGKAIGATLVGAAQAAEAAEEKALQDRLPYNTTQVPVALLQGLANGFIPYRDLRNNDRSFDTQVFHTFFNQLLLSLGSLPEDDSTAANAHLEAPISFISYLYLEAQRKNDSRGEIRLTKTEADSARQIQVNRQQVESLVETMELIAGANNAPGIAKERAGFALTSLRNALSSSEGPILGVSVAALAHAYRLREENFFELDSGDSKVVRDTIRHILAVANAQRWSGEVENVNESDLIRRIATYKEDLVALLESLNTRGPTYLLPHELDLARRVLLGTPENTTNYDKTRRSELAEALAKRLRARGHRTSSLSTSSSPAASSSPEINGGWIKNELSAAVQTVKKNASHALGPRDIPAIKAQFQRQMEAASVNAEIFEKDEPIRHNLGDEPNTVRQMVGLGSTSTATFVIVYQPKVDRTKSEPLGPGHGDLNPAGQAEFNEALNKAIDNNGDLVMPAYHQAIYELILRKMGFTQEDFSDYAPSAGHVFQGEGFEVDINEYLSTAQMPNSFWEKCNQYFSAAVGDYNRDRVLAAVNHSIQAGLTESNASFVTSAGAANFMTRYREAVAVEARAYQPKAQQRQTTQQRALEAARNARANKQKQRRLRGARIVP